MNADIPLDTRLADLQRVTEVGFAKVDGKLALFEARDVASAALEEQHRTAIDRLNSRVDNLDRKVARAAGLAIGVSGALSATSGLIIWALSHH
jgi:hypothetical protein